LYLGIITNYEARQNKRFTAAFCVKKRFSSHNVSALHDTQRSLGNKKKKATARWQQRTAMCCQCSELCKEEDVKQQAF
jgi:hypothetical protein